MSATTTRIARSNCARRSARSHARNVHRVLEQPKMADAASELFRDVFGVGRIPVRLVFGVASLPLGMPVELDVIFEVA
jgi:enamine deaminase RidA (YjgF/YER057c/UK114 family)